MWLKVAKQLTVGDISVGYDQDISLVIVVGVPTGVSTFNCLFLI